jgi:hypothetical protein
MPFLGSSQTRTGTSGGGYPLYVPNTGNSLAGVLSVNSEAGVINIAGDAGLGVSNPGSGVIQLTTVGRPVNASTGTFSGAVTSPSMVASGGVSGATVSASGAVSAASLAVGAPGAQGNVTYINTNIAYSGTTQYNVGIPINYPALITLTASLAVGTGFLNAVFCTVNTNPNSWGLRQVSTGSGGVQYFSVNPDTPAGTQLQVSVPGGGTGTLYTSYKIERTGV